MAASVPGGAKDGNFLPGVPVPTEIRARPGVARPLILGARGVVGLRLGRVGLSDSLLVLESCLAVMPTYLLALEPGVGIAGTGVFTEEIDLRATGVTGAALPRPEGVTRPDGVMRPDATEAEALDDATEGARGGNATVDKDSLEGITKTPHWGAQVK